MLLLQLGDRQEWVSADRLKPHVGDFLVKFRQTLSPPPILFGISTVILSQAKSKLTRSAGGGLLAPHLGVLVPALLEATSEMEGQQLSYLSTRLGVDNAVQVRGNQCLGSLFI